MIMSYFDFFYQALLDAGGVIYSVIIVSLIIFAGRVREIYPELTQGTRRALVAYGLSGISMIAATSVGLTESLRFLIYTTGAFFLGCILIAQLWILFPFDRARKGTVGVIVMLTSTIFDGILQGLDLYLTLPDSHFIHIYAESFANIIFTMTPLLILLIGSVYFAVVLLRENPSLFTVSLFAMLVMYLSTWVIGATGWIWVNPEYFMILILPLVVAATIFSTVRMPAVNMIAAFLMLFAFSMILPLIIGALYVGDWATFVFGLAELIVANCLIAPLNYFTGQAVTSGARAPRYISVTIVFVTLLVIIQTLGWAMYNQVLLDPVLSAGIVDPRDAWNQYMIWFNLIIGAVAAGAYMLGSVSSVFGDWVHAVTREAMFIFGTALALLAFPLIQEDRWDNNLFWLMFGVVVIIGLLLYTRVAVRIYRAGGKGAAGRLMSFVTSIVMIAVATMFSDDFPLLFVIVSLMIAGGLAVLSSPPATARILRTLQRRSTGETIEQTYQEIEPSVD